MMLRVRRAQPGPRWRAGFSVIELVIVIAVVGIIAGIATPTYVGWRADSRNAEAVRVVEEAIAVGRVDAKRRATAVMLIVLDESTTFPGPIGPITIPHGGEIVVDGATSMAISFGGTLGVQAPFEVRSFGVRTGAGAFERTATVSVIPPLGKTAVVR